MKEFSLIFIQDLDYIVKILVVEMKIAKLISYLSLIAGILFLYSCGEDGGDHVNSTMKLLPSKVTIEYEASNKYIYNYKYDDYNRLTEYTETSLFGNNFSMEDVETTCKIIYGGSNEIDSLIIIPRLVDSRKSRNISGEMYSLVKDTIVFEYEGQAIHVKYKNKKDEQILINSRNEVTSYKYYTGSENNITVTNLFEYDDRGNVIKSTISNGTEKSYMPYTYMYDKRNGAFRNMNVPQWFLVIMLNSEFNLMNNYKQYIDYEGNKWTMEYEYNNDDYPIYKTTHFEGTQKIIMSEAPTTIEYINAK